MSKVKDYDATIRDFLNSVAEFLTKRANESSDMDWRQRVIENCETIRNILIAPHVWGTGDFARTHNVPCTTHGFMKQNSHDNRIYLKYRDMMVAIGTYYNTDPRHEYVYNQAKENIAKQLKGWKYITSTNMLKDFIYPFKSAESFLTHVETNNNQR